MRYVLYVVVTLVVIALLVVGIGLALPVRHVAAVRAGYSQPPDSLYQAIVDVERAPAWRSGLDSVRVLSRPGERLQWREYARWGALTFAQDEITPSSRVVSRIADESEGFGGTWTYEIAPSTHGSVVVITEHGEVRNPLFRFLSRFVFGYYHSLETYATDLGRRFHEEVAPERVER